MMWSYRLRRDFVTLSARSISALPEAHRREALMAGPLARRRAPWAAGQLYRLWAGRVDGR
jgi:hypothetical protein